MCCVVVGVVWLVVGVVMLSVVLMVSVSSSGVCERGGMVWGFV